MIVDERISAYINSLDKGNSAELNRIEKKALEDRVPIIRTDTQAFLKYIVKAHNPKNILEVGTAVGFSCLLFCENMAENAVITTIEKFEKRIPEAKKNFKESQYDERIRFLEGDASDILPSLKPGYDMIFMDAAKGQYQNFFPEVMRLLKNGGILLSDNVLQDGDVIESRYAVTRRDRTIHTRMREYLYELKHNEQLETSILPIGDGLAVSVKLPVDR